MSTMEKTRKNYNIPPEVLTKREKKISETKDHLKIGTGRTISIKIEETLVGT